MKGARPTSRAFHDWCSRQESNLDYNFRKVASYPLNDESLALTVPFLRRFRKLDAQECSETVERGLLVHALRKVAGHVLVDHLRIMVMDRDEKMRREDVVGLYR